MVLLAKTGMLCRDQQYANELFNATGVRVSKSSVQKDFHDNLCSTVRKVDPHEIDKFTAANWLKHQEFLHQMQYVSQEQVHHYDQTGLNFPDLVGRNERWINGVGPDSGRRLPSGSGHVSFFGCTSLRLDKPAVYFKSYKATRDNQQTGAEHIDFFMDALDDNIFEDDFSVIIQDGWSAHTGAAGKELNDMLFEDHGIVTLQLAARFSHLNSVEHTWRRSKGWAKNVVGDNYIQDANSAGSILAKGLERITHFDVAKDRLHDGYAISERLLFDINTYSAPSGPYVHPCADDLHY